ncbi:MAG TPA: class I SAM-dependent methyltransferase [Pyrinomonadaceae bacterium]|nr:class I SAM-dependent methyltransferase [Pyrinomonadaceae bacterium]
MNSVETSSAFANETAVQHADEISRGIRFGFGKNWAAFLGVLDDDRIERAERSLSEMLETDDLSGRTFLDIGSGSGLFSLAARRLGATVFSFDFDTDSVACAIELRRRYFPDDDSWSVEQGSVLDDAYMASLGQFDIVYSWGVLHHTGQMWKALENAGDKVKPGGKLFIAIYNDTGSQASRWRAIKAAYCRLPGPMKKPFAVVVSLPDEGKRFLSFLLRGKPLGYFEHWKNYRNARGMNRWHDIVDWVGGYPYEVAGPSALFDFFKARGFELSAMKCDNVGLGCNEMVFFRKN